MKDQNVGFRGLSSRKLFPKRKPSGTAKQVTWQDRITAKKILRHLSPGNRNTMKEAKELKNMIEEVGSRERDRC